jgi:DNA methylase
LSNSRIAKTVSIKRLKPYDNNPLTYPRKQLRKIEALIRQHEQIPTILVTSDMTIISGEEWWLALKNVGRTDVRVEVLADLSPADAKTVRLALGRLPLDARLDQNRLRAEFAALQADGIDLGLTGYDKSQIDFTLEVDISRADATENFDVIPKRQNRAVSRLGVIFQLGAHRIGCGDACDQDLINWLREGRPADVCIADPPYLRSSDFEFGKGRNRRGAFIEASREMSDDELYALLFNSLDVLQSSSAASALIYAFGDWRHILKLTAAGEQLGMPLGAIPVWIKPDGELGGLYRSAHEFCAVFKAGTEPRRSNRNRMNVWNYAPPAVNDELLGAHSTVKPVAMLADILRDCTKRGDLVIDTFLGSGSTLIAAEETGRICIGTELNPRNFDVSLRRWQTLTGRDAIHLGTGQRFDDIAQHLLTHQGADRGTRRGGGRL